MASTWIDGKTMEKLRDYAEEVESNNGKTMEKTIEKQKKMQFRCVTTMSRRTEIKPGRKSNTVYTVQRLGLWEVHLGTR